VLKYDSKNNKYIDFEAGVWCTALGHNHPRINEAMKNQIDKMSHCGFMYSSPVVEEAAKEVLSTLEDFEGKCLFLSSGSEAVEFSIKVAKAMMGAEKFLTFNESYLSAYGTSGNKGDSEWIKFSLTDCSSCSKKNNCQERSFSRPWNLLWCMLTGARSMLQLHSMLKQLLIPKPEK